MDLVGSGHPIPLGTQRSWINMDKSYPCENGLVVPIPEKKRGI